MRSRARGSSSSVVAAARDAVGVRRARRHRRHRAASRAACCPTRKIRQPRRDLVAGRAGRAPGRRPRARRSRRDTGTTGACRNARSAPSRRRPRSRPPRSRGTCSAMKRVDLRVGERAPQRAAAERGRRTARKHASSSGPRRHARHDRACAAVGIGDQPACGDPPRADLAAFDERLATASAACSRCRTACAGLRGSTS